VVGITFLYRSVPLPDRYSTTHQRTRSGTSRIRAWPSSGKARASLVGELGRSGRSSWSDRHWEPNFYAPFN